jgi:hypothetical protein
MNSYDWVADWLLEIIRTPWPYKLVVIVVFVMLLGWSVTKPKPTPYPLVSAAPITSVLPNVPESLPASYVSANPLLANSTRTPLTSYLNHQLEQSRVQSAVMNVYLRRQLEESARQSEQLNEYVRGQMEQSARQSQALNEYVHRQLGP